MEPGEKELRKVFEENTTTNVKATVQHSNETRKMVRTLEARIQTLENMILTQNGVIEQLKKQIAFIQQRLYAGGT